MYFLLTSYDIVVLIDLMLILHLFIFIYIRYNEVDHFYIPINFNGNLHNNYQIISYYLLHNLEIDIHSLFPFIHLYDIYGIYVMHIVLLNYSYYNMILDM